MPDRGIFSIKLSSSQMALVSVRLTESHTAQSLGDQWSSGVCVVQWQLLAKKMVSRLGDRSLNLSPLSRERLVWSVICGYTWGDGGPDFSRELKSGWWRTGWGPQLFPVLGRGISHSQGLLKGPSENTCKLLREDFSTSKFPCWVFSASWAMSSVETLDIILCAHIGHPLIFLTPVHCLLFQAL